MSWRALAASLLIMTVGVGVAATAFSVILRSEKAALRQELAVKCRANADLAHTALSRILDSAADFRAFVRAKTALNQSAFTDFGSNSSINLNLLFGISFSMHLTSEQRDLWESKFNIQMKQSKAPRSTSFIQRDNNSDYLPAQFVYPLERLRDVVGFDNLEETQPARAVAARKALSTSSPTITEVLSLVVNEHRGLILYFPVYNYSFDKDFPPHRGTVNIPFDINRFFHSVFLKVSMDVNLLVEDLGVSGEYNGSSKNLSSVWQRYDRTVHYIDSEINTAEIVAVDRIWSLKCTPSQNFYRTFVTKWSQVTLSLIIFGTMIIAIVTYRGIMNFQLTQQRYQLKVTQLKESLQVYNALSTYSKTVVKLIPDPLLLVDSEGYIIGFNAYASDATGYDRVDFRSRSLHIYSLFYQTPPNGLVSTSSKSFESPAMPRSCIIPGFHEVYVRRKDGSVFCATANVSPVMSLSEDLNRLVLFEKITLDGCDIPYTSVAQVVIFHDITDRIEQMNRLAQSENDLRRMSEERKNILLWLCHELRNPFQVISSSLTMLQETFSSQLSAEIPVEDAIVVRPKRHEICNLLNSASLSMGYLNFLVDDILEYMDVGIKRTHWTDEDVKHGLSVNDIILYAKQHTSLSYESKPVAVFFKKMIGYTAFPESVEEQRTLMVDNLSNANALTTTLIRLTEFGTHITPAQSKLEISVCISQDFDNAKEDPGRLLCQLDIFLNSPDSNSKFCPDDIADFDAFSFEHASRGAWFGGVGLSVAVIKKILAGMDGDVIFLNRDDKPKGFSMRVSAKLMGRLVLSSQTMLASEVERTLTPNSTAESGISYVLVVEDNLLVQTITKKLLEKLGYSVLTANDGVEGVATIQTCKKENRAVSLVLMDLVMPNMSGYEATEIIRKDMKLSVAELPIIAVTANALESERTKCIQSGLFNEFLTKPVRQEELRSMIRFWTSENNLVY